MRQFPKAWILLPVLSDLKNQLEAKQEEMFSKITEIERNPKTNSDKSERISFPDEDAASERSAPCVPQRAPPVSFSLEDHRLLRRAVESSEEACE